VTHKLTPAHLQRRAIVYVRQSSPTQILQTARASYVSIISPITPANWGLSTSKPSMKIWGALALVWWTDRDFSGW
jgi:hypothetical protein